MTPTPTHPNLKCKQFVFPIPILALPLQGSLAHSMPRTVAGAEVAALQLAAPTVTFLYKETLTAAGPVGHLLVAWSEERSDFNQKIVNE